MASLLDAVAYLDLIDRVDEVVGNVRYGSHQRFNVPRECAWSGHDIESLLGRHGVRIWGRGFTSTDICFNVKGRQANWAEYLLKRRGIPVSDSPVNPKNDVYAEKHAPGSEPPGWRRRPERKKDWLDSLLSFLTGK